MAIKHKENLLSLLRLHQDYNNYVSTAEANKQSPQMQKLRQALQNGQRIEKTIATTTKRVNALLGLALEICGLSDRVDHWYASLDKDVQRLSDEAQFQQRISFILNVKKKPWKGNFKECPLYKVMPLSFPVEWLDQPTSKTRKEMMVLFRS